MQTETEKHQRKPPAAKATPAHLKLVHRDSKSAKTANHSREQRLPNALETWLQFVFENHSENKPADERV